MRGRQQLGADPLRLGGLQRRRPHPESRAVQRDERRGVAEAVGQVGREGCRAVERRERKLEEIPSRHTLRGRDRREERRDRERENQVAHALRQYPRAAPTSRKRFPPACAGCRFTFFQSRVRGASVLLTELLTVDRVRVPLGSRTKSDVLRELVELAATRRNADSVESMLAAVREREQVLSTGIGGGVAIPHGKTPQVEQLMLAAGVARDAIDFDALDGQPV